MHQSKAWWPWLATLVVLFIGCGSDSAATDPAPIGSVANELAAAPSAATGGEPINAAIGEPIDEPIDEAIADAIADAVNGAIQGSADPLATDWTSTAGTVAPFEVIGKGTAALALELPRGRTETCSGELSFEWKRTDTLEFQLWMQTPTESFGEVQVVLRPSAPGATEIKLPAVAIHDKQAGVFHTIVSSVESEGLVVGEDAPVQVCIVINAEAGRYVVDDVQFTYPPPIDDGIGDVTPIVTTIAMSSGLTSFSTGYAGAPTLTTSEPDPVPDITWLLGPNRHGATKTTDAEWDTTGLSSAARKATDAKTADTSAVSSSSPKARTTGAPSIASFELDDPDFCTTETLLPTAPFVSSVSPAPNGTTIPYPLCTAAQYAHVVTTSDLWSSNFVLMGDIDLGALEAPPSTAGVTLSGVFEGNGRTLSNYSIESSEVAGVLGKLGSNGIIRNLVLRDFNVSGVNRVAALVHESRGLIEHVTGTNLTVSGSTSIGVHLGIAGVVGVNNGTLSDVTASVNVTGVSDAYSIGGLVGRQGRTGQQLEGFMADCSVSGSVTRLVGELSTERVSTGGALGYLEDGSVVNTHASVIVVSAAPVVGGLAGYARDHIVGSSAVGAVSSDGGMVGGLVGVSSSVIQSSFSTSSVSAGTHVGGLVGYTEPNASIIDSYATGPVQGTGERVGGLCGTNRGVISRSYATGGVQGVDYVGGLAGLLRGSVEQSWSSSDISATGEHAGGLVGLLDGQIDASHFRGDVTGVRYVGGLVGTVEVGAAVADSSATGSTVTGDQTIGGTVGSLKGTAERCWATASVSANTGAGGLVGGLHGTVIDSYATGAVSAAVNKAGGLVATLAATGSIVRAYAVGSVNGASPAGGFVAETLGGTLEDCHFNATENPGLDAVGTNPSATGVTPNSDAELRQTATFTDWDFEEVWGILEGSSFPFLQPVPSCASGGCSLGCPCPPDPCTGETDCAFGQVCGEANGGYFDNEPDANVCWDPLCDTNQRQQLCAAEGAPCGACAPTDIGCSRDADCEDGQVCGEDNGGYFRLENDSRVCWDPLCESSARVSNCGVDDELCGLCSIPGCSSDADCPDGQVCGIGAGLFFDYTAVNVCWDAVCETAQENNCGAGGLCGMCTCTPNCSGKSCGDDASDGCGGVCQGFCNNRDGGCNANYECATGSVCVPEAGDRIGLPPGTNVCLPEECIDNDLSAMDCGETSATCGECPDCASACEGRACGPDPAGCAVDCGTCESGACMDGQCVDFTATSLVIPGVDGPPVEVNPLPDASTEEIGTTEARFAVNERGAATYEVPIEIPPGRAGLEPHLSVRYASTASNGYLGVGWSLEGLSQITRCNTNRRFDGWPGPVRMDDSDKFCLDGRRLMADANYGASGTEYYVEPDNFSKVVSWGRSGLGPEMFKVWTRDGRIL
ncbi:MAG TPA: GLUG motif-containing protein, partial [Polyangiaceae bacterium]|nr:GLUG motif-containing protein [Polyangiaceae bacterium]